MTRHLSSEELRILKAAAEGRLVMNNTGRWIITPSLRPDGFTNTVPRPRTRARDHLQRRRLIGYPPSGDGWGGRDGRALEATPAGLAVLKAEEAKDA